jgi:hypothetical protein
LVAMMFLLLSCSSGWTVACICLVNRSPLGVHCRDPFVFHPSLGCGAWLHLF